MAFVGEKILNAWYFTCLMYVNICICRTSLMFLHRPR